MRLGAAGVERQVDQYRHRHAAGRRAGSGAWRFDTAAPRRHSRLCAEARLTLAEAQLAVVARDALPAAAGGQALIAVCDSHGLDDAVRVLDPWLRARD
jgi:hypothetical protein